MTHDEELPIFVVEGANWSCEVLLDEDDFLMELEEQKMESLTKALELIKGVVEPDKYRLVLTDGDVPYIGPLCSVHIKDTNPEKTQSLIPSFIAFANGGFYMDSLDTQKVLQLEMEKLTPPKQKRSKKKKNKD